MKLLFNIEIEEDDVLFVCLEDNVKLLLNSSAKYRPMTHSRSSVAEYYLTTFTEWYIAHL